MINDVKTQLDLMEKAVDQNLERCCKEILEWHKTGKLEDGKVREAAQLLTDAVFEGRHLVHVEDYVKTSAMLYVIANEMIRKTFIQTPIRP